jgi:hypothetical protein
MSERIGGNFAMLRPETTADRMRLTQAPPLAISYVTGRWSASGIACCRECGTNDRMHLARGLCKRCYQRRYNRGEFARAA